MHIRGKVRGCSHHKKWYDGSIKSQTELMCNSATALLDTSQITKGSDLESSSNICIHGHTTHDSQDVEVTRKPMTDEWLKPMWSICAMEYYSVLRKEGNSNACCHMDLKIVKQTQQMDRLYGSTYLKYWQ
jgi:hypothetical protein